jgi:hypothetical protein
VVRSDAGRSFFWDVFKTDLSLTANRWEPTPPKSCDMLPGRLLFGHISLSGALVLILGVDPGSTGGLAWLRVDAERQRLSVRYARMPWGPGGLDVRALWDLLVNRTERPDLTLIERVGVFLQPGSNIQRNRSAHFALGKGVGRLEAVLTLAGLPFEDVAPQSWQASVGARGVAGKQGSFNAAARWFPGSSWVPGGCRTPHDGIVEAALIALHGAIARGAIAWEHPLLAGRIRQSRIKRTEQPTRRQPCKSSPARNGTSRSPKPPSSSS